MVDAGASQDGEIIPGLWRTYSSVPDGGVGLEVSLLDCSSFSSDTILSSFEPLPANDRLDIFRKEQRQECDSPYLYGASWHSEDCNPRDSTGVDLFADLSDSLNAPPSPKRKSSVSIQPSKRCCRSWINLANPIDASSFDSVIMGTNEISLGLRIEQTNGSGGDVFGENSPKHPFEADDAIPESSTAE
mmetsp:Transcript_27693/g.39612  ORF Transcript_27693/g.39612 Transcript_27693/m.39612 type:complete len:188 (-) Transcript_27693:52-615(-)|eukprot:CAMPEP_0172418038 /NCGR_PEP_ID=MMETSP1064-20121228/4554_1 /TAXON_ID=202472 /ORGANISM="Aulacoseira subarctica , Strain CCAP 1002/5" /LENGTH=187 /DNA_ID=CAMNT_0013156733 /DNA_START=416 /DNA_END=979 /DNA_ORIENTATION=+